MENNQKIPSRKKMKHEGLFVYKALHGHDDLESIRRTMLSIESMPKGHSADVQVLVEAKGGGLHRIKDIRYNQNDRSIHIVINPDEIISHPDYEPDNDFMPPIIGDDEFENIGF